MKTYKKVELEAVNTPSGSYAAGCPAHTPGYGKGNCYDPDRHVIVRCKACEVAG